MENKSHILLVSMILLAGSALADTHYVVKDNSGASSPFTDWTTAASNIQQAIDDTNCVASDTVIVSNGVYDTGAKVAAGRASSNRVVISKAITVRAFSTNWADTVIKGQWDSPATTNGPGAVRGVYMVNGSSLIGFTVTNGACITNGGADLHDYNGGGVCSTNTGGGLVSNCLIIGNNTADYGGGVAYAVARNCTIEGNTAIRGGGIAGRTTFYAKAYDCTITRNVVTNTGGGGGGAWYTTISNCTISFNSALSGGGTGGGVYGGGVVGAVNSCWNSIIIGNSAREGNGGGYRMWFYNCLVVSNAVTVLGTGGGLAGFTTADSLAINCTIVSNRVHGYSTGNGGGGIANLTATNCIILGNWDSYGGAASRTNNYFNSTLTYCCTTATNGPAGVGQGLSGAGNITSDVASAAFADFAVGNYRLTPDSPCINKGANQGWMTGAYDMDGHRRIIEGTVDIGAYEFLHRGTVIKFQ